MTPFAVARLCATDEKISLQFTCVNSELVNLDSGKPSKCHVCIFLCIIATVQMWQVAALSNAVLCWLRRSTSCHFCRPSGPVRFANNCLRNVKTTSLRGHCLLRGVMPKGQVLRSSAFQFQKNHICHICLEQWLWVRVSDWICCDEGSKSATGSPTIFRGQTLHDLRRET